MVFTPQDLDITNLSNFWITLNICKTNSITRISSTLYFILLYFSTSEACSLHMHKIQELGFIE